ncbi:MULTISPECIES: matrixin family metalloprotease [Nocardia]|uniref:Matrix metalloproteinase-11 n=1 Tax=Nocardia sputorum TaxID=2984338 RepID=A0ABN6U2I7_9NOCA|nr:matrixin family metalloprotease [Nocardia sputorum]BDT90832.1 matrix metalloproteinase-11 [Nocardia sputorum]BDT99460.1 matrix metalloproteinase-11 [Nocardia sputorum]
MARSINTARRASSATGALRLRDVDDAAREVEADVHVYGQKVICETDSRGYATPQNRSLTEIVVDASEGFIPLWDKSTTLRWRFQNRSIALFEQPDAAKAKIKELLGKALLAWGDAAPVKFSQRDDAWDFEIVIREADRCNINGCVLASAFFPDSGRHRLTIYPKLFEQSAQEQMETLAHEIGHVFGLRHFFANLSETDFASEIFGKHNPLTIMNYGNQSQLTEDDRDDLKRLYQAVWSGTLTNINGTPIRLVKPFSSTGTVVGGPPILAAAALV